MVEQTKDKVDNPVDLVAVLVLPKMRHQVRDQEILVDIIQWKVVPAGLEFLELVAVVGAPAPPELMALVQLVVLVELVFRLRLQVQQQIQLALVR
jgi:hypothetical protein